MANPWARDRATRFYLGYAFFALVAALLGFSTTYILPMAQRSFSAPWTVHLHGASALAWILLLISQAWLVRRQQTPKHRLLGRVGLLLSITVWASGIATANWAAHRDVAEIGTIATSNLASTSIGLTWFMVLVLAGVAMRRRPDWHKRLILLGTIQLLWPAIFRWRHVLPPIPDPDIWLAIVVAYTPILIAALRDKRVYGRVHPVWLYVAPILVVEQSVEFAYFDRGVVRSLGQWLFALFS